LSKITGHLHATPVAVPAVLVVTEVADPIEVPRVVAEFLLSAVREAERVERGGSVGGVMKLAGPVLLPPWAGTGPALQPSAGWLLGDRDRRAGQRSWVRGSARCLDRATGRSVMGVDRRWDVGDGGELERAPRPPSLWDAMREQVDRAFADLAVGAGPEDAA
jgi:hypothetical protein